MLRIIVQTSDCGMAANIGGHVETEFKTFDIESPEVEAHLRQYSDAREKGQTTYWHRNVIGVELLQPTTNQGRD